MQLMIRLMLPKGLQKAFRQVIKPDTLSCLPSFLAITQKYREQLQAIILKQ